MQVVMIRIEQVKDGIKVNLDNLSREDSTDAEMALADTL